MPANVQATSAVQSMLVIDAWGMSTNLTTAIIIPWQSRRFHCKFLYYIRLLRVWEFKDIWAMEENSHRIFITVFIADIYTSFMD